MKKICRLITDILVITVLTLLPDFLLEKLGLYESARLIMEERTNEKT